MAGEAGCFWQRAQANSCVRFRWRPKRLSVQAVQCVVSPASRGMSCPGRLCAAHVALLQEELPQVVDAAVLQAAHDVKLLLHALPAGRPHGGA